jgi:hypothetical protein
MRIAGIIACLGCMVALGFYTENLKVAINYRIALFEAHPELDTLDAVQKEMRIENLTPNTTIDYYYAHPKIGWIKGFDRVELKRLKWVHTIVFTGVFLLLNLLFARILNKDRLFYRSVLQIYILLFVGAMLIYGVGMFTGFASETYGISRKMVGVLQSPLPVLISLLTANLKMRLKEGQDEKF